MDRVPVAGRGVDPPPHRRQRARRAQASVVTFLAVGIFVAWLKWRIGGATSVRAFDDVATAIAALAATLLCLRAGLAALPTVRRFWVLLAAAGGAWTMAEVIWAVYDLVLRVPVPIPSWADLGYLSAIPLAVGAIASHPALSFGRQRWLRATFDGVVVATALFFLSWTFVLGPLWRRTDLTSLGGIVAVAYPFGDIIMVFLVVLVIREMPNGDRFAICCVLTGVLAMAMADSTYTYLTEVGRYTSGDLVDAGWVAGYMALALGAFCSSGAEAVEPVRLRPESALRSLVVPFVPTLLALAVVAIDVATGRKLHRSDWFIAMALVVLSLVRQLLMFLDQVRPTKGAGASGAVGVRTNEP